MLPGGVLSLVVHLFFEGERIMNRRWIFVLAFYSSGTVGALGGLAFVEGRYDLCLLVYKRCRNATCNVVIGYLHTTRAGGRDCGGGLCNVLKQIMLY